MGQSYLSFPILTRSPSVANMPSNIDRSQDYSVSCFPVAVVVHRVAANQNRLADVVESLEAAIFQVRSKHTAPI